MAHCPFGQMWSRCDGHRLILSASFPSLHSFSSATQEPSYGHLNLNYGDMSSHSISGLHWSDSDTQVPSPHGTNLFTKPY